jgi:8-oxo-dGTP diphosphatase
LKPRSKKSFKEVNAPENQRSPARFCFWQHILGLGLKPAMVTVVAGLIECGGELLVCQRRRGSMFELMWEFPGGKVQAGEDLRTALARELREELGVRAEVGRELHRQIYKYEQMPEPTELVFFNARAQRAAIRNIVFERIEWRAPKRLLELDFLPADRGLIELLASGRLRTSSAV